LAYISAAENISVSSTTFTTLICPESYRIRWHYAAVRAS